jgi:23S rRNA (uracil1939-C5)-methyltransferase
MPQPIELTLTKIAASGEAVGSLLGDARPVLVADAIPGERVRVEIVESDDEWHWGRLLEVLEASPDRVAPPCPYFGPPTPVKLPDGSILNPDAAPRCAGCAWQHIAYERQLALKREIIVGQLAALGKLVEDVAALGDPASPDEDAVLAYGFCTEMDFGLDKRGRLCLPDRTGGMLAVEECLLHHSQLAQLFAAFAVDEETGTALAAELSGVSLAVGGTGDELSAGRGGALVLESRRGDAPQLDLDLPVNVFLRRPAGESAQADLLVGEWTHSAAAGPATIAVYPPLGDRRLSWPHSLGNEAIPMIAGALLEVQPFEYLLDIWAGFGVNSVVLAEQCATIVAVEDDPLAGAALQSNLAGVDSVDFLGGTPDRVLKEMMRDNYRVHAALLSPPAVADVLPLFTHLLKLGVARLAIITDESAELAQAVAAIHARGYSLTAIQPVDLQPHQESVTLIARFDRLADATPGYVPPEPQSRPQSRPARPPRLEESPRRARSRRTGGTKKGSGTKRSK